MDIAFVNNSEKLLTICFEKKLCTLLSWTWSTGMSVDFLLAVIRDKFEDYKSEEMEGPAKRIYCKMPNGIVQEVLWSEQKMILNNSVDIKDRE